MLNENTAYVAIDSVLLHSGQIPSVEEMQQQRENDYINAARQRSAARQRTYDRQRAAVDEFRQNIYGGPINSCYCCTRLCYSNDGSFIDQSDLLLLPIHDRELSESVQASGNAVWICSRCKTSLTTICIS